MATSRLCSILDCDKPVYGFDFCRNHYRRFKSHGDPLAGGTFRGVPLDWVRSHTTWPEKLGCLDWPFSKGKNGYGNIRYRGASIGAHRAMCFEAPENRRQTLIGPPILAAKVISVA